VQEAVLLGQIVSVREPNIHLTQLNPVEGHPERLHHGLASETISHSLFKIVHELSLLFIDCIASTPGPVRSNDEALGLFDEINTLGLDKAKIK
jgi:hypothetical protein